MRSPVRIHAPVMECSACGQTFEAIFTECEDDIISEEEAPTKEDQNVLSAASPRISRRSWILISVVVLLMGGAGFYAKYIFDSRKAKVAEEMRIRAEEELRTKEYAKILEVTMKLIEQNSEIASLICQTHLEIWQSAVNNNRDINQAIQRSLEGQKESIHSLRFAQQYLEIIMQKLNSLPPEYKDAKNRLVSIYGTANQYFDLAISPSGNLGSYGQSVKNTHDSLSKQISELNVTLPK